MRPVVLIRRLWREDRRGFFGLIVVIGFAVLAIAAPLIAPYPVNEQSLADRFGPPVGFGGVWSHPLGTDTLGRDVLSRLLLGARNSLWIGIAVVALAGSFGTMLGLVAGYMGGKIETVVMRLVDILLAFPGLLIALVLLTFVGPTPTSVVLVIAARAWMVYTLLVRATVQTLSSRAFIEASIINGAKPRRVILRHLLPNLAAPLSVVAVLEFAQVMLSEAALSFLGLGIQPPNTSWGADIETGRHSFVRAWWLVTFPGAALTIAVIGMNFLGGWLRTALDPEARAAEFKLPRRGPSPFQGIESERMSTPLRPQP
jgi:ABC-type dipeptide/oligopeptide/nickel transport system permease subunit